MKRTRETRDERLSVEEVERDYPLMTALFGYGRTPEIERITGFAKDRAHYIFAPMVERALKDGATFVVQRRRKTKRARRVTKDE